MTGHHGRIARALIGALAGSAALASIPAAAQNSADAPLIALVQSFVEAARQYDQKRLAELTTADYAEVSPIGDLDLRDDFLGFYAPDKKRAIPLTTLSEPFVRRYGDTASVIARLSFERPGSDGQPPRKMSLRVGYLAVRSGEGWKLAAAQYTPERPAAAPAK